MKPGKVVKNFYSVARGHNKGIFTHWSTCEKSVHRYPNATFKGFATIGEAIHFLLAGKAFASCKEIPVYINEQQTTQTVKDMGHSEAECSCCCAQVSASSDMCDISIHADLSADCVVTEVEDTTQVKELEKCNICKAEAINRAIQCSACYGWCHYACTRLPDYALYTLSNSKRKYTCEVCTNAPKEDLEQYRDSTFKTEVNSSKQVQSSYCQTTDKEVRSIHCQTTTIVTESGCDKVCQVKTCMCQCDADANQHNQPVNTLLEDGLVKIMDQLKTIKEEVKEIGGAKNKQERAETSKVNSQMTADEKNLQKELSDARKELEKCQKECKTLRSDLEKEKTSKNQELLKYLEEHAKLEQEIRMHKITKDGKERCITSLQKELDHCNKLYQDKLNENQNKDVSIKKLQSEINGLRDEMLAVKLHSCREDSSLIYLSTLENVEERKSSTPVKDQGRPAQPTTRSQEKAEPTARRNTNPAKPARNAKKQILVVGTSNIKYTSARFMAARNTYVRKVIKYTIKQASDFISAYKDRAPDMVVFHMLCNDAENLSEEEVCEQMNSLVTKTKSKFPDVKVLVSLATPRGKKSLNEKMKRINNKVTTSCTNDRNVEVCDNSNLYYRSYPLQGVLSRDEKHLSRWGTSILTRNIKEDINTLLTKYM